MAPRAATPRIQTKLIQLGHLGIRQRLDIRRRNELLLVGDARHLPLDIAPDEGPVLGEIVPLLVPRGLAAAGGRGVAKSQVYVAQILHVHLVPDVLALADQQTPLALQHSFCEPVGLHALLVARAAARTVDRRRADDGCLHAGGVAQAGVDDDLVHVPVQGVVGKVDELVDAFPVIVLLAAVHTPGVGAEVFDGQDASAGGVDKPDWILGGMVGDTFGDGFGRCDVVTVGAV